jgi:isopentenyl phosphate kinase
MTDLDSAERLPTPLYFLKLGGSLITDKTRPLTARLAVLTRLVEEIAAARVEKPDLRLLVGHGAGSFGHISAREYGTRLGVHTPVNWLGFAQVWREANALNRLVLDALIRVGLPAVTLAPSAGVTAQDGQVAVWNLDPLRSALEHGLLPVVHGDVIFDCQRGGTILSTEDLFAHLARQLCPQRLLLAGSEEGVWADFPARTRLIEVVTPGNLDQVAPSLGGSGAIDVTGGMASKVQEMLALAQAIPGLQVLIFSGEKPDNLRQALLGTNLGTVIRGEG